MFWVIDMALLTAENDEWFLQFVEVDERVFDGYVLNKPVTAPDLQRQLDQAAEAFLLAIDLLDISLGILCLEFNAPATKQLIGENDFAHQFKIAR